MFHIVLFEPEIPPNTGNIIRLCANTGSHLHLIKPFGFSLDHKSLKRAGLDYHEFAQIKTYSNFEDFTRQNSQRRIFACTTKGTTFYHEIPFHAGDAFLFGPETRGLPTQVIEQHGHDRRLKIPMMPTSRSLNLANSVAIIVYEAWRQSQFTGALEINF